MEPQAHIETKVDVASKEYETVFDKKCYLIFHTDLRKPYKQPNEFFGIEHLVSHEPFGQFKKWFEEAVDHVEEPNAFCLAPATK
jgi:hypothetical protein